MGWWFPPVIFDRNIVTQKNEARTVSTDSAALEARVTELESELAASERRLRATLTAAVDAIVMVDGQGMIRTFNPAAERMFGYTRAEAMGMAASELLGNPFRGHDDQYLRRYLKTPEGQLIGRLREFKARRKDGSEFPIQLLVTEVPELGLFTGIVRDITEQRKLQEEIVRIAAQEQRRIGEELHDTALQDLAGLGLLAQNLADALGGQELVAERLLAQRLASGIADAGRHVRSLAQGLVPVAVDAEGLMAALTELATRTEREHALSCRFVCPEPVEIADDLAALHLFRIAQEAVTNAVRHADAQTVTIRLERQEDIVTIKVLDDGIGIAQASQRGPGLGLRIMEHRCALLGGTFSALLRDSGGTEISCRIHLAQRDT